MGTVSISARALCTLDNGTYDVTLSDGDNSVTVQVNVSGYVYAEAVETYTHAKIPYVEVRLADEAGNPIAQFCSSGYRKNVSLDLEGLM